MIFDTDRSVAAYQSHIALMNASYCSLKSPMADVKLPDAISIFALSACSKATLHMILLDVLRSESSIGFIPSKPLKTSSSSADLFSISLMFELLLIHNVKVRGAPLLARPV